MFKRLSCFSNYLSMHHLLKLFLDLFNYLMCRSALPACIYVQRKVSASLGLELWLPRECCKLSLVPLQRADVLLTTEPSL